MANTEVLSEARQRVWIVPASPVIWATHFMASYVTVALWCGMVVERTGTLLNARVAVGLFTAIALAGIGGVGWLGYRAHSFGAATPPHDDDTPEDRHRFIGFATLLLSGLSAVAVIYSALTVVFIETCQ
jgi:hypothetical protein